MLQLPPAFGSPATKLYQADIYWLLVHRCIGATCRRGPTTIHALADSFAALNLKKCPILLTFAVLKIGNLYMENTEPTRAGAESRAR